MKWFDDWVRRFEEGEAALDEMEARAKRKAEGEEKIVDVPGREPTRRVLLTPTEQKWPDGVVGDRGLNSSGVVVSVPTKKWPDSEVEFSSRIGGPGSDSFEGIWWCSKHQRRECMCESTEVLKEDPTELHGCPPRLLTGGPEDVTLDDLVSQLETYVRGAHVMVHSSYKSIRPVVGGPQTVVDAFVKAVGPKGCVLFPTYDFHSFSELGYWDKQMTPSQMGIISEKARLDRRFRRTAHPILSYAIYQGEGAGSLDAYPYKVDPIAHGAGSVFDLFLGYGGVLVSIGALEDSNKGFLKKDRGFTISNHAAMLAGVSWRKMKKFQGIVANGPSVGEVECWASVTKDPSKVQTAVSAAHQRAEDEGIITKVTLGNGKAHIASAQEFVSWAIKSHHEDPSLWRRDLREEIKLYWKGKQCNGPEDYERYKWNEPKL